MRAVETINANETPPEIIVLVDNASAEPERAVLRDLQEQHPNVHVIFNEDNEGYFRGLNTGIAYARRHCPKLAGWVIGNNDLEFAADFSVHLAHVLDDGRYRPVISPYVETLDGVPQNPHVVSGISRLRELVYDAYYSNYRLAALITGIARLSGKWSARDDENGHAQEQYIYQGHGSCYVLTPLFFEHFEELWSPTFLMGEEYFLSRQIEEKGFMTFYDPRIRVRHRCNGAIQNVPRKKMWQLAAEAHKVYRRYVSPWHKQDHSALALQLKEKDRRRSCINEAVIHR